MGDPCGDSNPRDKCGYQAGAGDWIVHYLCEETGVFDGRCPVESEVTFFLTKRDWDSDWNNHGKMTHECESSQTDAWRKSVNDYIDAQLTELGLRSNPECKSHSDPGAGNYDPEKSGFLTGSDCGVSTQVDISITTKASKGVANTSTVSLETGEVILPERATCGDYLDDWLENWPDKVKPAHWDCKVAGNNSPDSRCYQFNDLLAGKKFYIPSTEPASLSPLKGGDGLVNKAFNYVTKFQSSAVGASGALGFMPGVCDPLETTGYCYSPEEITEIANRNECLLYLYARNPGSFTNLSKVTSFLQESLGFKTEAGAYGVTKTQSGFEKLYAELMIMVGDDAITTALSSRFDLAELTIGQFEGSKFEPQGMDLTGLAGGEMRNLYKAAQAFQAVVDRFQRLWLLISAIPTDNRAAILSSEMVTTYLGRVIDAAKKKTRVWSAVAERYHNFERSDLARLVVERGYSAAALESALITSVMKQVLGSSTGGAQDEIRYKLKIAQRGFTSAMTRMLSVYGSLDAGLNYFGFSDGYIPFPGLEIGAGRDNGFEVQINRAKERMSWASQKETEAIETARTFAFDAASFFAEIAEIENRYESQIIE